MSVIKKGIDEAMKASTRAGKFLQLQADNPVDVVLLHGLDEVQSVDQHDMWEYNPAPHLVCLGEDCPCCALGNEPRTKSYIGVVTKEQEVKYLPSGASILGQLQRAEKAVGNLTGRLVRFEKTGSGLKTKYTATMLGKKIDVSKFVLPDLEDLIGPLDLAGQLEKLEAAGVDVSGLKTSKKASGTAKKSAKRTETTAAETPVTETTAAPSAATEDGKAPWDDAEEETESIDGWAAL